MRSFTKPDHIGRKDAGSPVFCGGPGRGIDSNHLSRLFDRFWQARDTDKAGVRGWDSIAKGIVEAMATSGCKNSPGRAAHSCSQ